MRTDAVQIVEVGPRDGLQAEPDHIPTARKIDLIEQLMDAGLRRIEATSFVSPAAVPQLADAEGVLAGVTRRPDVELSALVPNARGLRRALAAGVDRVAIFASASETFALRNLRCSIAESLVRFEEVLSVVEAVGIPVRGYISMAWWCPFEGRVDPTAVTALAARLVEMGCDEVALADTVGHASPAEVRELLRAITEALPATRIAVHLHDTSGQAVANVEAAAESGVRVFDGSVGGLGGCPFAPGSPGNLSTERLVGALEALGFTTGVDLDALVTAAVVRPGARRAA